MVITHGGIDVRAIRIMAETRLGRPVLLIVYPDRWVVLDPQTRCRWVYEPDTYLLRPLFRPTR